MVNYTNEQAREYAQYISDKQGAGTLHGWVLNHDMVEHAQQVLTTYINATSAPLHKVFDVGCGTGEMLYQIGEIYPAYLARVGVNLFPSQIEMTPAVPGLSRVCADFAAKSVPARDVGAYDLVMCNYTLGHFEGLFECFSKMYELLTPGGTLGLYDIARRSVMWNEICGYHLYSKAEIRDSLNLAGFVDVHEWCKDYMINPLFADEKTEEGRKLVREWETKTSPFLITAHKEESDGCR